MSLGPSRPGADPPSARATARVSVCLSECHAQLTQQLDAYYGRTKLLSVLADFVRSLTQRFATRRLVPTNPYAPLLTQIRQAEISAYELLLVRPRDLKTLASQDVLLFDPRDKRTPLALENQIATFNAPTTLAVWATRAVIERIPYSSDWQRRADALYAFFPLWLRDSEGTDESCHVVSVGAMVDTSVFFLGAAQADAPASLVELERHLIVSGDQLEPAMAVFARQQIRSLFEATKKHAVLPLADGGQLVLVGSSGLVISSSRRPLGAPLEETVWTLERVTANRQGFVTAVQLALVASGSFTLDLLYERRVGSLSNDPQMHVVRCKLSFFFHFDHAPLPTNSRGSSTAPRPSTSASRSFVGHSRMEQSGICWTPRAAHEISCRVLEQRERDAAEATTASRVPGAGARSLVTDLVTHVARATRTSSETRHWLDFLPSTETWRLAQISSLLDIMVHTIRTVPSAHLSCLLRSSIASYKDAIAQLVQDARVGRSSSLLHGLDGIVSELCGLPEDPLAPDNLYPLYQSLQRSQDTVAWLASAAVRDFCQLVQRTTTPATADDAADGIPCADLRADISAAIEARRFPLAIVAELVFAQYLVETKLDVALERSLVNTVASGLPPNPFVVLCTHLRVFARQHVGTQEWDRDRPSLTPPRPSVRAVDSSCLYAIDLPAESQVLVSANERLLASLSLSSVMAIHQYLTGQHVYSTTAYHPPKATYSARVIASLLVDDPLLLSSSSLVADPLGGMLMLQSIEVIEHVVIEGRDFVQALQFFADAIRRDILRLLEQVSAHGHEGEIQLLDPSGDIVTAVGLHDLQTFEQLVVEATQKQCLLQVVLPPAVRLDQGPPTSTEPLVRLVSKKYVFHHSPTEPSATGHAHSHISDAFKRRWQTFGVGFAVEEVQTVWELTGVPGAADGSALTAFAARATRRHDLLLLDHLERMAQQPTDMLSRPPAETLLLRWLDVERVLEWLLQRLVFQQQTSLTPRSEAAALAAEAKALLTHVANAIELIVVPRAAAMGMVDVDRVVEAVAHVRSFCSLNSDGGQAAVATSERLTRRLWALVVIVRFASQADTAGGPAMAML